MAKYRYPDQVRKYAVEAYRHGLTAGDSGKVAVFACGWTGPTPAYKTVLRWARMASIPPVSQGTLLPDGQYPEDLKQAAVEAYRAGATAEESAVAAVQDVGWTGTVPHINAILRWVRAAGIRIHNEYPEAVKLAAIEAYKAGASMSRAGIIAREKTGWTKTPSYQTVFRWVVEAGIKRGKDSEVKRKSKFPESVQLEAVQAYMQGATARKAGEIASKNIGWPGRAPSHQTVINWVRAAGLQVRKKGNYEQEEEEEPVS